MATRARIKTLMDQQLASKAAQRRTAAADTWTRQKAGFYFPGNEDTVDLCVMTVLNQALAEDGTRVTAAVTKRIRELIGTSTMIDDAITILFLATAQPVSVS